MNSLHDWPTPVAGVDYLSGGIPHAQEVRFGYYDLKYTLITALIRFYPLSVVHIYTTEKPTFFPLGILA